MILKTHWWYWTKGLSKELCDDIKNCALQKKVEEAKIASTKTEKDLKKQKQKIRNSQLVWLKEEWIYREIENFIYDANVQANWNFNIERMEDMQFTIYHNRGFYDWHADQGDQPNVDGDYKGKIRKLSMSILLNDPKEFKGGDLQFDLRNTYDGKPNILIPEMKEKGSIVVFPSFLWHRVIPVTKGTRYSLVCWSVGDPYK